jgi:hypothetical protein
MIDPIKTYLHTTPRHLRFMFFIDSKIKFEMLADIAMANMSRWGGRFNPIVPVQDNKISDLYLTLIRRFDPDYIFYSSNVDIEKIKEIHNFNCFSFSHLNTINPIGSTTFGGINCHNLINEHIQNFYSDKPEFKLLDINDFYGIESPLKYFYAINLGLISMTSDEVRAVKRFKKITINNENFKDINSIILQANPVHRSLLSQFFPNTTICRPKSYLINEIFTLIIYDKENCLEDFAHYWNRQLYIGHGWDISQMIVSKEEILALIDDPNFGKVFSGIARMSTLRRITSKSIPVDELNAITEAIKTKISVSFELEDVPFPYEILDSNLSVKNPITNTSKHAVIGNNDLLKLEFPLINLHYSHRDRRNEHYFITDIEIEKSKADNDKLIKLPHRLDSYLLFSEDAARINQDHSISLYSSLDKPTVEIKIPSDYAFITSYIQRQLSNQKYIDTGLYDLRLSHAGQKLSAFINLFNSNWGDIELFMNNKFWFDVFRSTSVYKKESRIGGRLGIYSHKDLVEEFRLIYRNKLEVIDGKIFVSEENEKIEIFEETLQNEQNNKVERYLQYLINNGAVFLGMQVPCKSCGANKWYSLSELKNKMRCSGCGNRIYPKAGSPIYYKTNEIIINNLFVDAKANRKDFDGNYVVLKALSFLRSHRNDSFLYAPCLDYSFFNKTANKEMTGDIDIVAVVDGKFVIGEAKVNEKEFTPNELNKLINLANQINPDKIILAYKDGNLTEVKVANFKSKLLNQNCTVEPYKVEEPWYWFTHFN